MTSRPSILAIWRMSYPRHCPNCHTLWAELPTGEPLARHFLRDCDAPQPQKSWTVDVCLLVAAAGVLLWILVAAIQ